jgi:GNAT superfamily N-acetyltransferase
MQFSIEQARSAADLETVQYLENRVFRYEKRMEVPELMIPEGTAVMRMLARLVPTGEPVGTLTVMETTGNSELHARYGVPVRSDGNGRVARFTRLAVLAPYRGQGLSMQLVIEAHRQFVVTQSIRQTWLLFDAGRAGTSLISTLLGYTVGPRSYRSEYGLCRVLFRDEMSIPAELGTRRGVAYLTALQSFYTTPQCEAA